MSKYEEIGLYMIVMPNKALQPTVLPPLRYGETSAELERWGANDALSPH